MQPCALQISFYVNISAHLCVQQHEPFNLFFMVAIFIFFTYPYSRQGFAIEREKVTPAAGIDLTAQKRFIICQDPSDSEADRKASERLEGKIHRN